MLLGETLFLLHCGKMHTFSGLFAFQPHRATSAFISLKSDLLGKSSKVVTVSMCTWIPPPHNFDVFHGKFCIDFFFFFLTGCCYYAFLVRTKRAQCRHSFLFSRASPSFLRRSRKYTGCALAFHNDVNEYEKISLDLFWFHFFPAKYFTFARITNKDNRTHEQT